MRKISFIPLKSQTTQPLPRKSVEGFNNNILYDDCELNNVSFNIIGDHNLILIHPGCQLNNVSFHIYGNNHRVIIGANCAFNERGSIWCEDRDCMISIGQDSTFEGVHLSATEPGSKLLIGQDCMFSYDIDVRTGDSHSLLCQRTGQRTNFAKNIVFGNHIWVASHCIFTKGTSIADNSVVGTGSLINGQFEQTNVVLAGRPAKIIKKNIQWLRERVYERQSIASIFEEPQTHQSSVIAAMDVASKTG